MALRIPFPPETEAKLRERAAAAGKDVETFVVEAIEEKFHPPRSFRDIFAPLHEAFSQGTLSEEETDRLLEAALASPAREQQPGEAPHRVLGLNRGKLIYIADDFDAPLGELAGTTAEQNGCSGDLK